MQRIDGGWFLMGSTDGGDNERPVHRVFVDAFELSAHQVTNAEYALFMDATGSSKPSQWTHPHFNHPDQPVVAVSWSKAVTYCEWLGCRLPTEAEWEFAARGGFEGRRYPWGDEAPESRPDYRTRWINGPEPVAQGQPNAFGLYDMCENVHEWCSDWYAADYYSVSPERNPRGAESGARRSSRGGSWRHHIKISRCAARSSLPSDSHYADYGFRVARQ